MNIAVVIDGSRPSDLAHARGQVARLRRAGVGVIGPSLEVRPEDRARIDLVLAVGRAGWRPARRLAKRIEKPVVYDHPVGTSPPARLGKAQVVIGSSQAEAANLRRRLSDPARLVIVPPDPPRRGRGTRPRLRQLLGVGGRTVALQEAEAVSCRRAETLVHAVRSVPALHLVFLGGEQWEHRESLAAVAEETDVGARVSFSFGVPAARRIDYLDEADVGLAFREDGIRPGRLPAADVFAMLGVPYVDSEQIAPHSCHHITVGNSLDELRAAIAAAAARPRGPVRDDAYEFFAQVLLEVAGKDAENERAALTVSRGRARAPDAGSATALLREAKSLRDRGDREGAVAHYAAVAGNSYPPEAIATAAAGLARLNARTAAREATERVMAVSHSALAAVRAGEAAALLGDLPQARACVDRALAEAKEPGLVLPAAVRVLEQAGEPRRALRVARRGGDEVAVARIEGVLASYDPTWLPPVGRQRTGATLPQSSRSLALLETSLPYARSGYTYRAQTLLRAQRRAGVEPTVLTRMGFPASRGFDAPAVEDVDGVPHHRAGLAAVKRYTSVPVSEQLEENVRWAGAIGEKVRPEGIVAATPHLNGLVGLALRELLGVPLVYDVRGFPEMTWAVRKAGREADVFALRRIAETRCMLAADLVATLSETMRRHIISRGVPAEKVFVLPHAVDTTTFAPKPEDTDLAADLGLDGRPVVGYISSLVGYEGVDTLLEAIALARLREPSIAGLIVGDGELRPSLEEQSERLGLKGHVVFTGRVDAVEIGRYYSLTDLFVCPRQDHEVTRYVTPLKPFEAMAAGCCLLTSDLPTLREAVRNGECGALFRAGDPDALAASVLALIEQPARRRQLTDAARRHVVANHSFDTLCRRFEELWQELTLRSTVSIA